MKICVVGLGYIGLPTAAVFASKGVDVLGVDVNLKAVETINKGQIHIVEPNLAKVVKEVVVKGRLKASLKPDKADVFIICVPTPFKAGHKGDLSYIKEAANSIAPFLQKGNLVILESTSPVGTTHRLSRFLGVKRKDLSFPHQVGEKADVCVAYCPERVLPGKIITELVENDRIVGGLSELCTKKAAQVYQIFVKGECIRTNARTAELTKLTENSFRDVNIAFANELSLLCDEFNIDVYELISLANRHPRVNILKPGCGVGGHCIAVDPWFIASASKNAKLIKQARLVNDYKSDFVLEKITKQVGKGKKISIFGLAFKPDIDDLRESPALKIALKLCKLGFELMICEPNINALPLSFQPYKAKLVDLQSALKNKNIAVLVAHKDFKLSKDLLKRDFLDFVGLKDVKMAKMPKDTKGKKNSRILKDAKPLKSQKNSQSILKGQKSSKNSRNSHNIPPLKVAK